MVVNTFLNAIATILHALLNLYLWIIIIASLISFLRPDPSNVWYKSFIASQSRFC